MRYEKKSVIVLLVALIFFQGCASSDKRPAMNQLQQVDSLKVVRHESPKLMKETTGSQAAAMTGIMFGAIGGAIGGAISAAAEAKAGKTTNEQCNLPDFGELVMNKFLERMPKEMAGWPTMVAEKNPVGEEFARNSGYLLVLNVGNIRLVNGTGFSVTTTVEMIDSGNNVIWKRTMNYTSKKFNRCTVLDELEAGSGKLLHEEYDYAAEKTISDFIAHLKEAPSEEQKPEKKEAANQTGETKGGAL